MSNPTTIIEYRVGRNVKGVPMSDKEWRSIVDQARATLDGIAAGLQLETTRKLKQWTEVHRGIGTWTEEDGTKGCESSAVITLYTDADLTDADAIRATLVDFAGELAAEFKQDAVALVWGVSNLVSAEVPVS